MKINRMYAFILAFSLLFSLNFLGCTKKKDDPKPSSNSTPTSSFEIALIHGGKDSPSKRWQNVDDQGGRFETADSSRFLTFSKGTSANGGVMGALLDVSDSLNRRGATWEYYEEKEEDVQGNKKRYTKYLRLIEIDNTQPNKYFIYGRNKLIKLTNDSLIYEHADYGGVTLFVPAK